MHVMRIGAAAAVATLVSFGAQAQALQLVEKIGDWNLYFSEALGNSCLAERMDAEGRQFEVGVDRKRQLAFAGLFAKTDAGMTNDKMVPVSFQLGDTTFTGEATQYSMEGTQGGFIYFNNLDFAYELAKQEELIINRADGEKVTVSLAGSAKAIDAVIACQIATAQ